MTTLGLIYCEKCGHAITVDHLPFNCLIRDELWRLLKQHQTHLCKSCKYDFATCKAKYIVFGDCIGNDNVIECELYEGKK